MWLDNHRWRRISTTASGIALQTLSHRFSSRHQDVLSPETVSGYETAPNVFQLITIIRSGQTLASVHKSFLPGLFLYKADRSITGGDPHFGVPWSSIRFLGFATAIWWCDLFGLA